jgi:hypothetical protein
MEDAWDDVDLAKLSINQMIGLWATSEDRVYHVKTSNDPCDGIGAWAKRFVTYEGGQTYDFIYSTQVMSNKSMRPVHDHIMATEHVRIAQLLFALHALKIPPRCIKCIKTDCVVVKGFPKKRKAAMMELAKLTYKDLPRLRVRYCESESQGFLDSYCSIKEVDLPQKDAEVFRLGEGKELQGNWKPPWRFSEQPTARTEWKELTKEEALSTILEGKGLLIVGSPGVGKTFWLRNTIASLRQAGKRVEIVSKTHASVQNIGCEAVTCDHWVRKHVRAGGVHCHTLVVEELTQINVQLWGDLALCAFKGVSFVCSGDFGQFQPICEHWSGSPVREGMLEQSDMIYDMCGGNRLVLTENMRSDAKLFGFYTSLGSNLEEALIRARKMFPVTNRPADYTLTMSHRNRMKINRLRNQQEALTGFRWDDATDAWTNTVFIRYPKSTMNERRNKGNQPQDFILWPGLQLMGAGHRCLKGMFYEVASVDEAFVELTCGIKLTHEQALSSLRLRYAMTYASCQGLTLKGVVRLDTQSPNFTMKHLYVGISRATAANLVEVI